MFAGLGPLTGSLAGGLSEASLKSYGEVRDGYSSRRAFSLLKDVLSDHLHLLKPTGEVLRETVARGGSLGASVTQSGSIKKV
jgi:hypothetical protein